MNRREAIKNTALFMGGAVFGPSVTGILNGCRPHPSVNWTPELFTESQAALISELSETILPSGNTPGAKELGVPAFIEEMVAHVYPADDRTDFIDGIEAFNEAARAAIGLSFVDGDADQRHEFTGRVNREALRNGETGKPFIIHVKELTLMGYFTSETGATTVLQHQQTPGRYESCQPLDEAGKTWAV
ncbi:MAG: gluconate 2-dehydrogenase subunit 3 family protein [Balneolales bacterium]